MSDSIKVIVVMRNPILTDTFLSDISICHRQLVNEGMICFAKNDNEALDLLKMHKESVLFCESFYLGMECKKRIAAFKNNNPSLKVYAYDNAVALTPYLKKLKECCVDGYLNHKDLNLDNMIKKALAGGFVWSDKVLEDIRLCPVSCPRTIYVDYNMRFILSQVIQCNNYDYGDIAKNCGISEHGVKDRLSRVMRYFGVSNIRCLITALTFYTDDKTLFDTNSDKLIVLSE